MTASMVFYSSIYSSSLSIYSIYLSPSFYVTICPRMKSHFKKETNFYKQYKRKMTTDKRFRQNHTKYLRFKAFRQPNK